MNKLYAVLYTIILFFAIIARVFECALSAMLESRCVSLSYFIEVFSFNFNDEQRYTPVSVHWGRVVSLWKGVL
jgi:hypothetical protein